PRPILRRHRTKDGRSPEHREGACWGGPPLRDPGAMTLPRNTLLLRLVAVAAVFFAALATFVFLNRGSSSAPNYAADDNPASLTSASTDTQIRAYQALVQTHPRDSRGYDFLAGAYLQKVR